MQNTDSSSSSTSLPQTAASFNSTPPTTYDPLSLSLSGTSSPPSSTSSVHSAASLFEPLFPSSSSSLTILPLTSSLPSSPQETPEIFSKRVADEEIDFNIKLMHFY